MPISREDFDSKGQEAISVFQFLRDNRDKAYSFAELLESLHVTTGNTFAQDVSSTLHLFRTLFELEKNGRIESRVIAKQMYYRFRN